jgi:Rap1a immunity proteins
MKAAFLVLILLIVARTTSSQIPHSVRPGATDSLAFITGNDLLRKCQSSTPVDRTFCMGYIIGAFDTVSALESMEDKTYWKFPSVCIPNGADVGQIGDVVMKYLVEHPERRDQRAAPIIVAALLETWKCPRAPAS